MHSAEEPADDVAQPFVEVRSRIACGVRSLTVEILSGPFRLVEFSPNPCFHVACGAAYAFFDLATDEADLAIGKQLS